MKRTSILSSFSRIMCLALLLSLGISSCKKSEIPVISPEPKVDVDATTIAQIKEMGFRTDNIKEFGEYYIIEDDIMISKKSLSGAKRPETLMSTGGKISQASTNNLVNGNNYHNVNISIDESIWGNGVWYGAVLTAITVWNSNPNSDIKLNLIFSDYQYSPTPTVDIVIRGDQGTLPTNVAAYAEFPTNSQRPGNLILVNSDFRDPFTNYYIHQGQGAWNVIHEIGHTLGLRHTNWQTNDSPSNAGANLIAGTPTSDPNSVMNGGTALSDYFNYSYPALPSIYDAVAINTLYPLSSGSTISPYIGGKNTVFPNGQATYQMSYKSEETGIYYKWVVTGINGTSYYYEFTDDTDAILNEIGFSTPGNYQLQCTISGGKYSAPVTATKNITVQ